MFTGPVEEVSNTNIFARSANGRQYLVYSMNYATSADLAMVLPLPVHPHPSEDAVEFINLKGYPEFFAEMKRAFPSRRYLSKGVMMGGVKGIQETLVVHDVGDYEASFVPTLEDFHRLDERFRISDGIWQQLPDYADYGFAVFKLKKTNEGGVGSVVSRLFGRKPKVRQVHPMAFSFPRRNHDLLYFPTIHVHQGKLPSQAKFDHMLFCQIPPEMEEYTEGWERSHLHLDQVMDISRSVGIIAPDTVGYRRSFHGYHRNVDTWIGEEGVLPTPAAR